MENSSKFKKLNQMNCDTVTFGNGTKEKIVSLRITVDGEMTKLKI